MDFRLNKKHLEKLSQWFMTEGIAYPWGENPAPYPVWISEVMLQQTTVQTAIPYFQKWMIRFPDIFELSDSDEQTVLRMWEGLGYYSRARNILKTARLIVDKYYGEIPDDTENLLSLPGIGPYTAAAIRSIAFGRNEMVFDANVKKILQRIHKIKQWSQSIQDQFTTFFTSLIEHGQFGCINEGLMQLGQIVCRKTNPDCSSCPFFDVCGARIENCQSGFPEKKQKKIVQKRTVLCCLVYKNKVFLIQRKKGLGQDLWFFPEKKIISLRKSSIIKQISLKDRVHYYTRYRDELDPQVFFLNEKPLLDSIKNGFWFCDKDWNDLPMASVYRKILKELQNSFPDAR